MKVLFLDDNPKRLFEFKSNIPSAVLAATAEEMIQLLFELEETAKCVFLDHDLGGLVYIDPSSKETGMEVVRWVVQNKPDVQRFVIHSLNYEAAQSMVEKLNTAGYKAEYVPFMNLDYDSLSSEFKDCEDIDFDCDSFYIYNESEDEGDIECV